MSYVQLSTGRRIMLSEVTGEVWNKDTVTLHLREGPTATVSNAGYQHALSLWTHTILPAAAGTFRISLLAADEETPGRLWQKQAVLGWAVTHQGKVYPVVRGGD